MVFQEIEIAVARYQDVGGELLQFLMCTLWSEIQELYPCHVVAPVLQSTSPTMIPRDVQYQQTNFWLSHPRSLTRICLRLDFLCHKSSTMSDSATGVDLLIELANFSHLPSQWTCQLRNPLGLGCEHLSRRTG